MKITDHKLSEGIALTFRVPEGNIKHPLIILCHGLCGIRNVLLPCFANAFTEAGFATITFDWHCCKVSDEAAFCLIQRPYISKTLLTRRISP
ncbi:alpha/beta hydrolase family protein, partial [Escherichia coli]|uniref:alpha/beta hydrolase family protein n=1 Tax=Escherichia coli TaxID=562 RepID=UPI00049FB8E1